MSRRDGWQGLHDVVLEVYRAIPCAELDRLARLQQTSSQDLALLAAQVALRTWGEPRVAQQPALVNVAALALRLRTRLELVQPRPGAVHLVDATDLHTLPGEPPRLLRRSALIIEARRPEAGERLFGDCASLGAYRLDTPDSPWWLVGLGYPDGIAMAQWRPRWGEEDLEASTPASDSPLISDVEGHAAWSRDATRHLVVLGLLLDAEGAPVREDVEREGGRRGKSSSPGPSSGDWTTRHIYLDDRRGSSAPTAPASPDTGDAQALAGRLASEVQVRGHIKRQRHGPGGAGVKWIYVGSYEARRWVAPGPRKTVVH